MHLTTAQKVTLAAHIRANTNTATAPDGTQGFVINAAVNGRDPTLQTWMANWYNAAALGTDAQPFANLNVWNPATTITQINAALNWAQNPIGAVDAILTNSWLKWQSMCWASIVDFSDSQVRGGCVSVWATANADRLGAVGCGKAVGKRVELALSPAAVATAGMAGAASVVPRGFAGAVLFGVLLDQLDIDNALFPTP